MPNENQPKKVNRTWLAIGAGSLLFVMMLPSILLLAKIAIGLIIVPVVAIAIKIASKMMSNVLEDKQTDQGQAEQQTTQNKVVSLAIGLISMFVGGLSLFTIAQIGLTATCAAVTALVLYEYAKDYEYDEGKKIGKSIDTKLDEITDTTTNFIVSNIEKLISPQERQA
ncbi:hypothetical protein [Candidatus Wolbachia massiliensis]|uniref:Uncharacterized protein n=1 Tax=Candidatus Wolbachia massiliensis TaxID=1845000 RepID=A0A7L7YKW4_9RICK|nr:hypothetical protein [Candidatus Wolbachia massiliensis]QOD37863.1 hypothetical protein ID128_03265 [Candidatus Wolbachia massiliensis]